MCWNAGVSITFGLIGLACAAFLVFVGRGAEKGSEKAIKWGYKKEAKWHALIVANIACVELSEFIIWLSNPPTLRENGGTLEHCPAANLIGTIGVFIFGFMNWMWIPALWAYMASNEGRDKIFFHLWVIAGFISTVGWCVRLGLGSAGVGQPYWETEAEDRGWKYFENRTLATCTLIDDERFYQLHWRFNMAQVEFLPNGYVWFMTGLMPLFFYRPRGLALACSLYGVLSYAVPFAFLTAVEVMSMY
jgi:hypothetical protein